MKKFLVLYHSPISNQEQMKKATPELMKAAMDGWMKWAGKAVRLGGSAISRVSTFTR